MAYFNYVNNAEFYSAPTAPGEFGAYPFLGQMPTNEEINGWQTPDQIAGGWNTRGQPDYMVGGPANVPTEADFGEDNFSPLIGRHLTCGSPASMPSVTSHPVQTFGYGQLSYHGGYWPADGQYAPSHHSDVPNWDGSISNTVTLGAPMMLPTPGSGKSSFPLNPWVI